MKGLSNTGGPGVASVFWLALLTSQLSLSLTSSSPPPVPGDCLSKPFRDGADSALELLCHLSAINSHAERTNFSVIPADHTVALTVTCTDTVSVSQLEPRSFRSLVWLEELSIIDCNFQEIPDRAFLGLTRLRSLNIKSSTEGVLTFSRGSFEGLANLQRLDLSRNKVRLAESGILCSMPNLSFLNLSQTELGSVADLGLSTVVSQANCLRNVKTLDLSANMITAISSQQVFNFPSVERIDISSNYISNLDLESFVFTKDLSELDLSNNRLSHLPPEIFSNCRLSSLSLANNSLTSIHPQLFSKQTDLVHLDLSGNLLDSSELKPSLFAGMSRLLELHLNSNRLVTLHRYMASYISLLSKYRPFLYKISSKLTLTINMQNIFVAKPFCKHKIKTFFKENKTFQV